MEKKILKIWHDSFGRRRETIEYKQETTYSFEVTPEDYNVMEVYHGKD